jgi:hypothetical protein
MVTAMKWQLQYQLFVALLGLGACGTRPTDVADPNTISLKSAVLDVSTTLNELRVRNAQNSRATMVAEEASVTFNISAKSVEGDTLKLGGSLPASVGFPFNFSNDYQLTNEGNRGNQITIKFKNIALIEACRQNPRLRGCNPEMFR